MFDKHGTASHPIVIDGGGATINGNNDTQPCYIKQCSHFILRNWNFHNSHANVLLINECTDFRIERVCAWDAGPTDNYNPLGIHYSSRGVIKDCGFWGTGRKAVSPSQDANDLVFDRCWAHYDGTQAPGNKMTWTTAYNSQRNLFVDCIGVCNSVPEPPVEGIFTGVWSVDHMSGTHEGLPANSLVNRCMAFSPVHSVIGIDPYSGSVPIEGLVFRDCIDATIGHGAIDMDVLVKVIDAWEGSTILDRLFEYAGAIPLNDLLGLVHE